jgi:hypothetical protein
MTAPPALASRDARAAGQHDAAAGALLVPMRDAPAREVERRKLHIHAVAADVSPRNSTEMEFRTSLG